MIQLINVGTTADDGTGDKPNAGGLKINYNVNRSRISGITIPDLKVIEVTLPFTVPAGRQAIVAQRSFYNPTGSAIPWIPRVNGLQSEFSQSTSAGAYGFDTARGIFEAGDVISLSDYGAALTSRIVHWEAIPFFKPIKFQLASGDNTFYTCPAGKRATFGYYIGSTILLSPTFYGWLNTNGSAALVRHYVLSGTKTYLSVNTAVAANAFAFSAVTSGVVNAGESFGMECSFASGVYVFGTVHEFDA